MSEYTMYEHIHIPNQSNIKQALEILQLALDVKQNIRSFIHTHHTSV